MSRPGGEAFARLAQQLNRARLQASSGGGRGGGGGGGQIPNVPGGALAGGGVVAALVVGGLALNYSLFNGESLLRFDVGLQADEEQ
jgi:prohibitin 2